jgi:hypothetical protein
LKRWRNSEIWLIGFLLIVNFFMIYKLWPHHSSPMILGDPSLYHWFSWTGAGFLFIAIPVFYYLKRYKSNLYQGILRFHIWGNIGAIFLISIHFTYQIGSPPILGTYTHLGLTLFITLIILLITGILLRFQFFKSKVKGIRFIHTSLVTAFYLVAIIHILHGLDVI